MKIDCTPQELKELMQENFAPRVVTLDTKEMIKDTDKGLFSILRERQMNRR